MIQILCILSQLLQGNQDCIEIIYRKKKLIENNETMQYYLLNGLENEMLYTYSIYYFKNKNEYYLTTNDEIPENFSHSVKGDQRILELKTDENITKEFLSTFLLHQCQQYWIRNIGWNNDLLKYDTRFCNHVLINCLNIEGFIRTGTPYNQSGFPEYEMYRIFIEPTLREKINALNYVYKKHGIIYLDMLKDEFLNLDIYVAIILREDGSVESIMGAHGEYP